MRIETYFQQIREITDACLILQSSNLTYDKRGTHEGFLHGELYFADGSTLHLREFVDVETNINRLMYQYLRHSGSINAADLSDMGIDLVNKNRLRPLRK